MTPPLAARATRAAPAGPLAFVAAARALEAQGHRIARLDIGEPHLATPAHITEAARRALHDGETRYAAPQGLPALRQAIGARFGVRGIDVSPDDVVVGSGVKPLLLHVLLAITQAGDEILVPDPGYPGYAAAAQLAGAATRRYPVRCNGAAMRIDIAALQRAITPATRVLVLNSPHNPTGMIIDAGDLRALAELAERHDLWIVSDEIYSSLWYDGAAAPSMASIPELRQRTIVLDGFSKTYAMTGWRLGYALLPPALVAPVTAIVADASTCTPPFVQHAGIAALTGAQQAVEDMRRMYRARRDALVQCLRAIPGIDVVAPAGAFYAFADVGAIMDRQGIATCRDAAALLLDRYQLACVPGVPFGPRGERHLRLSFAVAEDVLDDALRRLEAWGRASPVFG